MFKKALCVAAIVVVAACAARSADFSKIPNPIENAKAGQWVSYTQMGGMEMKQTITNVEGSGDDRVFTMKIEMKQGDMAMPAQEQKISYKDSKAMQEQAQKASGDVEITEEKVTVNGKEYDAVVVKSTQQGAKTTIWMSKDVPVAGILKMEIDGMPGPVMELSGYGE